MNTLDIIVVVVLLMSAGLAFARGFIREMLSIVSWLGALAIAYYGYAAGAKMVTSKFLPEGAFANGAAAVGLFVIALIVLSIITGMIGSRVSQSKLSSFDRLLGLIFGIVRGAVLVSLGFMALTWVYPGDKEPDWVKGAHARPLLAAGKGYIEGLLPQDWREKAQSTANSARQKVDTATEADSAMRALTIPRPAPKATVDVPPKAPNYSSKDQQEMNRLSGQVQDQH